jgi:hypothetical protein
LPGVGRNSSTEFCRIAIPFLPGSEFVEKTKEVHACAPEGSSIIEQVHKNISHGNHRKDN